MSDDKECFYRYATNVLGACAGPVDATDHYGNTFCREHYARIVAPAPVAPKVEKDER